MMTTIDLLRDEQEHISVVLEKIKEYTLQNKPIRIPRLNCVEKSHGSEMAYLTDWTQISEFAGSIGEYQFLFEGEDDLLHLVILRKDLQPISVEDARRIVEKIMPDVPTAKIWLSPGIFTQHFYVGHDELISSF